MSDGVDCFIKTNLRLQEPKGLELMRTQKP